MRRLRGKLKIEPNRVFDDLGREPIAAINGFRRRDHRTQITRYRGDFVNLTVPMAYGFLACFAATSTAAFEDYALNLPARYPLFSVPVILGVLGGIGLIIGTSGLIRLKIIGNREPAAEHLFGADFALLALLWLAAAPGLCLLAFRATDAMGTLLAIHLGLILSLFVVLPYSKFVHGIYRTLALIRNAAEASR